MQVVNGLEELIGLKLSKPACVTIGNFDGCHLAHKSLLVEAVKQAKSLSLYSVAITFNPHPSIFLKSRMLNEMLFTLEQKLQMFSELDVDYTVVINFDQTMERIGHEEFYDLYLVDKLKTHTLVLGKDFRFGASRLGDLKYLSQRSKGTHKINLIVHDYLEVDKVKVSSTAIRKALQRGNLELANKMLARTYMIEGKIGKGLQVGRSLGFPTANLYNISQLIPQNGVYCGYVALKKDLTDVAYITQIPNFAMPSVFHIGGRPTFNRTDSLLVEASILKPSENITSDALYNEDAIYYFDKHLAAEKSFDSKEELISAITSYVNQAKSVYGV